MQLGGNYLGHPAAQASGDLGIVVGILSSESRLGGHADGVRVFEPAYETAQQAYVIGRLHVLLSAAGRNGTTTGSLVGALF